jgi:hypothetical protein
MQAVTPAVAQPVVLMTQAALDLHPALTGLQPRAQLIVAGPSRMRLALAPLHLPGAQSVWTDFRHSASLRSLRTRVEALGGIDQLVLAEDRDGSDDGMSHLSTLLTLLPTLRRSGATAPQIVLCYQEGAVARSLRTFLAGIAARLRQDGLSVRWIKPI